MTDSPNMTLKFSQSRFGEKKDFSLTSDELQVFTKQFKNESQQVFTFESISRKSQIFQQKNPVNHSFFQILSRLTLLSLVFSIFEISTNQISLALFTSSLIFFLMHRLSGAKYLAFESYDGESLLFLENKDKKEREAFLNKLWARRDVYLRKNYFKVNRENSVDSEKQRLEWLKVEKVITPVEFEDALFELEFGFKL